MTPQDSLGMGNPQSSGGNPSQLYNSISSQGMQQNPGEESQEPNEQKASPAEDAIQRFSKVFDSFETLTKMPEYAAASDQADKVKAAMQEWLNAVVAATSKLKGESPTY